MVRRILTSIALLLVLATLVVAADRPNIVWIVSEDNSIHYLDHFFEGGAEAPQIEALAAHGLTFDHAYSNAPVCSVARTTLATGCYGPRIGTQFHRRYALAAMPEGLQMFPALLRQAGYYTTNNSKKDYNAIEGDGVWDESSNQATWRNRPDQSQPFFHMQSHPESHEGTLHFNQATFENEKTISDPETVKLADYHPDTPLFRYTHARYLDRMAAIDKIVGETVAKLEEDGLLEDTFVIYFGDHGGVLPRSKGYLYDSGLHVPLAIRVPENFKQLVDGEFGERVGGFVSFVDFAPTTLHLAGVSVPEQMDGKPFLGAGVSMKEVKARDQVFGYADRFDEKYDFVRSIHQGRFQYLRHYQPYLPDGLQNNYRYKNLAYEEWRELFKAGELSGASQQFFKPKRVEHLYDCEEDPHQVNNLALDPQYKSMLLEMRGILQEKVKSLPDLSFYPESYLTEHAMENPVAFGQEYKEEIAELVDIADLALLPFEDAKDQLQSAIKSEDPMKRYWGAMACASFGLGAVQLASDAAPLLKDESMPVRIRAAEFLGQVGTIEPQEVLIEVVNTTKNPVEATEALNAVVWFKDFFQDRYPVSRSDFHPISKGADIEDRLNYINGAPYPKTGKPKGRKAKKAND